MLHVMFYSYILILKAYTNFSCLSSSQSRESNAKAVEVAYSKCVRNYDCNPYLPYLDCMRVSVGCYQDTYYCYWE